jgi:hypothetical protein
MHIVAVIIFLVGSALCGSAHLYPRPSSPPSPAAAAVAPTFTAGGVTIEPFLPDWWPNPE